MDDVVNQNRHGIIRRSVRSIRVCNEILSGFHGVEDVLIVPFQSAGLLSVFLGSIGE